MSPRTRARIAGVVYLLFFLTAVLGAIIFKSTFLPRVLGVLIAVAGVGWLTFLSPSLSTFLLSYLEVLGFAAEASLMLWLLVMGVNVERWKARAAGELLPTS